MELSWVLPTKGRCSGGVKSTARGQDKATTSNISVPVARTPDFPEPGDGGTHQVNQVKTGSTTKAAIILVLNPMPTRIRAR